VQKIRTDIDPDLLLGAGGEARDPDGSISRRGFARRTVIPGLRGKCAHGRGRSAGTPVNSRDSRIGVVLQVRTALARHGGSRERSCSDQCSRQKFTLSHFEFSIGYEKANGVGFSFEMELRSADQRNICSRRFNAA
jgi:hypothetical protein